jgi:hypothetical protein
MSKKLDKKEKYIREQISKRASRQKISSEAAQILWARELNLGTANFQRSLSHHIQDQVRNDNSTSHIVTTRGTKKVKKFVIRTTSRIPYLTLRIESDAYKMQEPYVVLYLLENSMRNFILKILGDKHGENWWKTVVTKTELLSQVKFRMDADGINKWHVPRGAHEIFYTDLEDLPYFFNKEKSEFEKFIDVELWTTYIKKVVKLSRNIVDHHNPLPKREVDRLKQILEDWKRQV